ncbi:hypothetical protein [Erythrobacter sp. F6033]|uniref:hypothetical protein n=1 Tax=Erythrobacter sp. F6033 TaxID=2926401 RepID=UPI001FF51073|nr:hypothetical protein [Erythrobacter sp. F6033]MCK0127904.1 hypothetical protein [Erythrobacter sp. F6033]
MRTIAQMFAGMTLFVQLILLMLFTVLAFSITAGALGGSLMLIVGPILYLGVLYLWVKLIQRFLDL